jgi:hydrogenase-4 component B
MSPGALVARFTAIVPGAVGVGDPLGIPLPATGGLPTLALLVSVVVVVVGLRLLRGRRSAAPAPTWACGQRLEPALNWSSAGFTKPVRLVLEAVLRPERELTTLTNHGVIQSVAYRGRVPALVEERIYAPLAGAALRGAAVARKLQSGRLSIYAVYLTGLLVGLLACARLGLLG